MSTVNSKATLDPRVGKLVLERSAGVDRHYLIGFHNEDLEIQLSEIYDVKLSVSEKRLTLCDLLFSAIAVTDAPKRSAMVALRRAIHNDQMNERLLGMARTYLPPDVLEEFSSWVRARTDLKNKRTQLSQMIERDYHREIEHLKAVCAVPNFYEGVRATSRSLAETTSQWMNDSNYQIKHGRVLRLARMAARASAKTSPFGTWMTTAPTSWGQRPNRPQTGRRVAELDFAFARRLTDALNRTVLRQNELQLRVNPSLVSTDIGYLYLRGGSAEQMVRVRSHPSIAAVLDCMEPTDSAYTLEARLGVGGGKIVSQCIRAGLLEVLWPVGEAHTTCWADWSELARKKGYIAISDATTALDRALLAADRPRIDSTVAELDLLLDTDLGLPEVHEMHVANVPATPTPERLDHATIAEIDCIRRLLSLFDQKLPMKIAASEFLTQRFGSSCNQPLTVVLEEIRRAATSPLNDINLVLGPDTPPWGAELQKCESSQLRKLGTDLDHLVEEVLGSASQGPLSVAYIEDLINNFPIQHPNTSATIYFQLISNSSMKRVINVIHGGHGRGVGRLVKQLGCATSEIPMIPTPNTVEIAGLLGSTLNTRSPIAPRELQYPGTTSSRPADQQLMISDIQVVTGPGQLPELRDKDGQCVLPVHLGMAADLALPTYARLIEQIFGSAFLVHPSAPPFTPTKPGKQDSSETWTPRIMVGSTVIQRARWFLQKDAFPILVGLDPIDLESWHQWVAERGLPTRFFLRAWNPSATKNPSKARKPVFVDITSRLLLKDAEKLLSDARYAIIEECLPDPMVGDGRVTEYAIVVGSSR